jgi:beta-glucosidase-like glycosyl hydrolase/CubicO group peptidase (beta-lactamase class C family)
MKRIAIAILSLVFLFGGSSILAQKFAPVYKSEASASWADSVLNSMEYRDKIGQLFMVDAFSNKDALHVKQITTLIDSFHIGGLIFFQGGPYRQALLNNFYQSRSKIPLMIGIDGEWGLSMRLDSTLRFPRQMTLSAGVDSQEVFRMGQEIAVQCKRMGIHVNFAPSVDVNNNPANPIINSRSFGEDKNRVALLGSAYAAGMQQEGVLACAKHFPGHGNTDTDSHLALPVVHDTRSVMDSVALVPFRKLIREGVASVMVAHLFIPELDSTPGIPGTLSAKITTGLLREELGFDGLVFTDALNMKGVAASFASGELELMALKAGNDVLLYSENIPKAFERIHFAIQNCEIEQEAIDQHVRRILMAKYWSGLNKPQFIDTTNLYNDLNNPGARYLNYKLYEPSVTLLRNKGSLIPIAPDHKKSIASLVIGDTAGIYFQQVLNRYAEVRNFAIGREAGIPAADSVLSLLKGFDVLIVSIHNTSINATKNFNITETTRYISGKLANEKNSLLCVFGNAYVLGKLQNLEDWHTLILCYEDTWLPQQIAAEKIFGTGSFKGHLPVSPEGHYRLAMGISSRETPRLKYSPPEEEGVLSERLNRIDTLVVKALADSAMPGCQVLVALHGNVIYAKAFGKHTYESSAPVKMSDLYDIASVTKMTSTGLALMKLKERHKIDFKERIAHYLPELRKSNKRDLTVAEVMAHQAGLRAWIPFWQATVDSSSLRSDLYRKTQEEGFSVKVADSVYLLDTYRDSIWNDIVESPIEKRGTYVYSDLGLIILQRMVEKITGESVEEYVADTFYKPMGVWQCVFNPLSKFNPNVIVPTEMDTAFRKQLIHGYVHDPAAAMLGGVSGNAGLFANAHSLAIIMQMLMNGGTYGGKRFLKQETIDLFTKQAFSGTANRRGMIFDRPDALAGANGPTAQSASPLTFGHTGFTGTCAWADPELGLVYVFLSNRVNPDAANNKLAKTNVRTNIMQVIYDSIELK